MRRLQRPAKAEPARSALQLSLAEREEISRGIAAGESLRRIAARLRRSPSTVAREVTRHGGRAAIGRAQPIVRRCEHATTEVAKLAQCARLRAVVEEKLELRWSPEQIAGWLVSEFPDDPEMRVSHETIYLSLFVQTRGALRKELTRYLRLRSRAPADRGQARSQRPGPHPSDGQHP